MATLLFLLCLGPSLTAIHELGSAHRYCLEHQTIEEAAPEGAPIVDSGERVPSTRALSAEAAAAHEGCPLAQALGCKVGQPAPSGGGSVLGEPQVRRAHPPDFSVSPPAVLIVAPKTSPPLAV